MSEPLDISIFGPAFLADPYPIYRRLREEAPVHWSSELGAWLVSRYADVKALLSDPRVTPDQKAWSGYPELMAAARRAPNVLWALGETLLLCHGATHQRRRRFAGEPFSPVGCGRIARVTAEVVREVLDGFAGRKEIDLIADYATPVRIQVMSRLLGPAFSAEEERFLIHGTSAALGFLEPSIDPEAVARNDAALGEFRAFVERLVDRAIREQARECIIADLFAPNAAGLRLPREEVIALVFSFLLAGTEANGSLITMGVLTLLEHPAQLALLLAEPERFPAGVREVLRYRNFTKFLPRYVTQDFTLHGKSLKKGQVALLMFQSAFRDPEAFEDPDVFDVTRERTAALPFGAGPHRCIGERMAEIEGTIALRAFFERFPTASLQGEKADWVKHHMLVAVPRSAPVVPVRLTR